MGEPKVSLDVAKEEFARVCSAHHIDVDVEVMDEDERKNFATLERSVVNAIMAGRVTVDQSGQVTLNARGGGPLTFKRFDASVLMNGGAKKGGELSGNELVRNIAAAMTEKPPSEIARLSLGDFKLAGALVGLFLAAE